MALFPGAIPGPEVVSADDQCHRSGWVSPAPFRDGAWFFCLRVREGLKVLVGRSSLVGPSHTDRLKNAAVFVNFVVRPFSWSKMRLCFQPVDVGFVDVFQSLCAAVWFESGFW